MKIKLKSNALQIWKDNQPPQGPWNEVQKKWMKMLEQVQGRTLEVETRYLWDDQYNTAPIPDVSKNGLRIIDFKDDIPMIEEIINDVRPKRHRCRHCNNYLRSGDDTTGACWWCGGEML